MAVVRRSERNPTRASAMGHLWKETVLNAISSGIRRADDVLRPKRSSGDFREMRRFLFLNYSPALGTSVNGAPVFEALKASIPNCQIGVACAGLQYQVLRYSPYIDFVWKTASPENDFFGAVRDVRKVLRVSGFRPDCICTDSRNARSRTVLLGYMAGAYRRAGFAIHPGLLDRAINYDSGLSVIDNNLKLLSAFGGDPGHIEPKVFFSSEEVEKVSALLGRQDDEGPPVAALITQGSGTQPTTWYDSRFAEIADYLHTELGFQVVFLGTEKEKPGIEKIRGAMTGPSLSFAGKTDIPELAALLAMSDLCVAIDTGTMHVARAVRLPLVLIASAWEAPQTWLPWNRPQIRILRRNDIGCRHCGKVVCQTKECLDEITVAEVKAAIRVSLRQYPPTRQARMQRISFSLRDATADGTYGEAEGAFPPMLSNETAADAQSRLRVL